METEVEPEDRQEELPEELPVDTKLMTEGNVCINENSSGGTCDHYLNEHAPDGGACTLCDCPQFVPNS